MTTAIDVRAVSRSFGRTAVLHDLDFQVPRHAILGLLGRNGAGKTTIMSIIAGQDRPSSGEVLVEGHTPFEHAPTLNTIRYIRDSQRYPDDYYLRHVLRIAPAFAPQWDAELAAFLVDSFALQAKVQVKKYSRGQLSALGIVLGLASRTPITLLDEPYLGLDVTARRVFYDALLRDLADHPRTVVLSTHLVAESESLFDRVVILDHGRVATAGDRDEVVGGLVQLSGSTGAVGELIAGFDVLRKDVIGGLCSALVRTDNDLTTAAHRLGIQVSGGSLQDLVASYGGTDPEDVAA
ncbi:ABC transporter ATP-binding protein [Cellulomonas denverensis]|uniref:ABC transporter ATP-binding protein n=1 Tax=Cellulomonas denverensis TaxID=264297 RepID=UPI0035EF5E7A